MKFIDENGNDKRIGENGKYVMLDNGMRLSYCEFGEENEEVIVTGAVYYHTFLPFMKELAKKYHIYGVVMRLGDDCEVPEFNTQFNADGSVNWARQWGEDVYQFTRAIGLEKFHYVGKCHGALPGWYLQKEHPDTLLSLSSLNITLHAFERESNRWYELQEEEANEFMLRGLKKHHLLGLKGQEAMLVGFTPGVSTAGVPGMSSMKEVGFNPEVIYDSFDEVKEQIKTMETPVLQILVTDDPLYWDYKNSNDYAVDNMRGARSVILQGERHLTEMDMPKLLAREVVFFIEGTKLPFE